MLTKVFLSLIWSFRVIFNGLKCAMHLISSIWDREKEVSMLILNISFPLKCNFLWGFLRVQYSYIFFYLLILECILKKQWYFSPFYADDCQIYSPLMMILIILKYIHYNKACMALHFLSRMAEWNNFKIAILACKCLLYMFFLYSISLTFIPHVSSQNLRSVDFLPLASERRR